MLRKKRKKIIRIRRNPARIGNDDFVYYFAHLIEHPTIEGLVYSKTRWNQGAYCDDCDRWYGECECEYCEDCKQNQCICVLENLGINDKTIENRIKIRKIIWELVRYYLNKYERSKFLDHVDLDPYTIKRLKISNKEYEFLKSLTSSSEFPKYTLIMKRLFLIE